MNRQQVFKQIEEMFGFVPSFFKTIPDSTLELEWSLMKTVQVDDGPIPNKYRQLIGVGIAASTRCPYSIFFHTELARLHGATDAELEEAVHFAQSSHGWSAYLNGMQQDLQQFRAEIKRACEHVRNTQLGGGTQHGRKVEVSRHS